MSIVLHVRTKVPPRTWDEFVAESPTNSIALDGYVHGGPRYDAEKRLLNFNHHEDVDRLATRATCAQVLMAIRQGLFQVFRDENGPAANVYVNDCDEDVCTSWYLLKNSALCEHTMNPLLNRLVMMEDALDATAGAYPFPKDLPVLRELAWVFEPYRNFRLSGGLDEKKQMMYRAVIEDVGARISAHLVGKGSEIALDTRYERIGGGAGWTMVREIGGQARTGMFSDGIRAFVSVRERGDGRYTYVIGRMSKFIPFDISSLYRKLTCAENPGASVHKDWWGGSDIIGGSPRVEGSRLTPEEVTRVIDGLG